MLLTTTPKNINKYIDNLFVNTNSIIRCEASSNYTKLFFTDKKPILIAKTLRACTTAISNSNFVRIHNSHLVNKNYVQKIEVDGSVFLKDGSVCNISRRKKREVRELLCAS
jgi:two-component system, LytTR family, response regulator